MKKRKNFFASIFIFVMCVTVAISALAVSIGTDYQTLYNDGLQYMEFGLYDEAAAKFEACGSYSDASSWKYYCMGMSLLVTATELENQGNREKALENIEQAEDYFDLLNGMSFADSAQIAVYCDGRRNELKNLNQTALDIYATVTGVLDAGERFLRLSKGIYLPPEVVQYTLPEKLPDTGGYIQRTMTTYSGPGSGYKSEGSVPVNAAVRICGKEDDYYLIEYENARMWINKVRVIDIEDGKRITDLSGQKGRKVTVMKDSKLQKGPGTEYKATDLTVKKGQKVMAYLSEDAYTMIEYQLSDGKQIRAWILTENLTK